MFFIPGNIISFLTFPGVIVHEIAHQLFCRICRVAVLDVKYYAIGKNPAGYVVHEIPKKLSHQVLIAVGPFFVNSIIGVLIAMTAIVPVFNFASGTLLDYFMIWLGVSIAMHSFPSVGDAKSILEALKTMDSPFALKLLLYPIIGLIYIGSYGSIVWLDLLYGVGISLLIPNLIISIMA